MAESHTYFVRRRGRVEGPWTIEKLKSEVALRKLGRHHELSVDKHDWFRASQLDNLFQKTQSTAPTAPNENPDLELVSAEPQTSGNDWYYHTGGEQYGPVSRQQLTNLTEAGRLGPEDLVWREGMDEWTSVSQIPDISSTNVGEPDETIELWDDELSPMVDRLAQTALALAICLLLVSPIPFVGVLGIIPVTMGILSLSRIRRSLGTLSGRTNAITAIFLGSFAFIVSTAIGLWTLLYGFPIPLPE